MNQYLQAIPVIREIVALASKAYDGIAYGIKWCSWKVGMNKLTKKKKDIENASTIDDWNDLLNQ
jgi:hypothetical protein